MLFQTNWKLSEENNLKNWLTKEVVIVKKQIVSKNTVNVFMLELNVPTFANVRIA